MEKPSLQHTIPTILWQNSPEYGRCIFFMKLLCFTPALESQFFTEYLYAFIKYFAFVFHYAGRR